MGAVAMGIANFFLKKIRTLNTHTIILMKSTILHIKSNDLR